MAQKASSAAAPWNTFCCAHTVYFFTLVGCTWAAGTSYDLCIVFKSVRLRKIHALSLLLKCSHANCTTLSIALSMLLYKRTHSDSRSQASQASLIILSCFLNLSSHSGSILSRLSGHSSCKAGYVQSARKSGCSSSSPISGTSGRAPRSNLVIQPFPKGNWNSGDRDRGVIIQTVRDRKEIFGNTTH